MSELRKKFIHGVSWTAASNIAGFLINFFLGVWLARILGPESYGLIGMILVVTGFARLLMDFGFGEALIQNQNVDDSDFSTVFWYNIAISAFLTLLVYFGAPLIVSFYDKEQLLDLTKALSLLFIINSLGMVQRVRLEKDLKFKQIGIAEVVSSILSISIALVLALNDFGVWSLVILHLCKPLFYSVLIWMYSKWLPSFYFSLASIKKLFRFSSAVFINGLFETIASSLDRLLIGKYLGALNLGVYEKSKSTVRLPVMQIMSALGRVIYPAFAKIQNDSQRIFSIYKKFVLIISTVVLPIMFVIVFFCDEIVLFMFGEKWIEMAWLLQVFSITAGFIPFNILADSVIKSTGDIRSLHRITFIEKPINILFIFIGVSFGTIRAVTISVTISIFLIFLVKSYLVTNSLKEKFTVLILEHLNATKIILLPLSIVLINYLFGFPEIFTLRVFIVSIGFLISLFMYRKSLIFPVFQFINNHNLNDSSN